MYLFQYKLANHKTDTSPFNSRFLMLEIQWILSNSIQMAQY